MPACGMIIHSKVAQQSHLQSRAMLEIVFIVITVLSKQTLTRLRHPQPQLLRNKASENQAKCLEKPNGTENLQLSLA